MLSIYDHCTIKQTELFNFNDFIGIIIITIIINIK